MIEKVVTVFGGTGFVGQAVVQKLAKKGAIVRVASRNPERALPLRTMGFVGQVTPTFCDIKDISNVMEALKGADAVINLVGIIAEHKNQTFEAIHHRGIENIGIACKTQHIDDLIHVSALGINSSSPSLYAQTKLAGESAALGQFDKTVILRPSLIYGPDDHFFNRFAALAQLFPVLPLIGGGKTRFQPIYVGDVASAIIHILEGNAFQGKIIELAGPKIYTFEELMKLLLKEINRQKLLLRVPFYLARQLARILQVFPHPFLTLDQVRLLETDAILTKKNLTLKDLHLTPSHLESLISQYLGRYKPHF